MEAHPSPTSSAAESYDEDTDTVWVSKTRKGMSREEQEQAVRNCPKRKILLNNALRIHERNLVQYGYDASNAYTDKDEDIKKVEDFSRDRNASYGKTPDQFHGEYDFEGRQFYPVRGSGPTCLIGRLYEGVPVAEEVLDKEFKVTGIVSVLRESSPDKVASREAAPSPEHAQTPEGAQREDVPSPARKPRRK